MAIEQALPGVLDGSALRADFPMFDRPHRSGRPHSFLDSAASSPKPRAVIDAVADTYGHHYANVHRGIYELSEDATGRFEGARLALDEPSLVLVPSGCPSAVGGAAVSEKL